MKLIGAFMVCLFFFGAGVLVGEHIVMSAYREINNQYRIPTKGEGFNGYRLPTQEKYSEQTRRIRR